jgi:ribosomal-protein-alanine N-acetyltransferase
MAPLFRDLETQRLTLRNICAVDADFIFEQFSDPAVCRYLYDEEPYTQKAQAVELIEFFCQPEPRNQHRWIVVRKSDGVKMGTCGFHHWNRDERRAETGYDLREEYWGSGYMAEAMKRILAFASEAMELEEVFADISVENRRSVALAEKLGFRRTGATSFLFKGKDMPHHVYTYYCAGAENA